MTDNVDIAALVFEIATVRARLLALESKLAEYSGGKSMYQHADQFQDAPLTASDPGIIYE